MFDDDFNFCKNSRILRSTHNGCITNSSAMNFEVVPVKLLPRLIALLQRNLGNQGADIFISPQCQSIILSLMVSTQKSEYFREPIVKIVLSLVKSIPSNSRVWEVSFHSSLL